MSKEKSARGARAPRRPAMDAQESRLMLMTAAADIMTERGSLNFSMTEVATRTGSSAGLIVYHFGSKDGLLLAIVEWRTGAASASLEALALADQSATEKLRVHIQAVVKAYVKSPFTNRLFQYLLKNANDEQAKHISRIFMTPIAKFHRSLLEQGYREGVFRQIDPMHFYYMLIGACEHLVAYRGSLKYVFGVDKIDEDLQHSYAASIYEIVMGGIGRG